MKKIITSFVSVIVLMLFSAANAAEFSAGIKGGTATLNVEDETSTTLNKKSGDDSSEFGAIFIEGKLPIDSPIGLSIGLEYIPLKATLDVDNSANTETWNTGGGSGDYELTVKDHFTLYLQGSKDVGQVTLLGRVGYVQADISDVKSSTAGTLTSQDDKLQGYTIGLGVQKELVTPVTDYVRLAVDYIDYDSVSASTSSKTYTGSADATTLSLSIGKKF